MTGANKRDRLIDSAAVLFHRQGMSCTSLADIAKHAEIPIGNVYYYFKTKDELALAALEKRRRALAEICSHLDDAIEDPRDRLIAVIHFFDKVKEEYTRHGCPINRMIVDGGEVDREAVARAASMIYDDFIVWSEKQFRQLGYNGSARALAITMLAGIQGGAVMAKAFSSSGIMAEELERLTNWIVGLPNKKIFLGKAGVKKSEHS